MPASAAEVAYVIRKIVVRIFERDVIAVPRKPVGEGTHHIQAGVKPLHKGNVLRDDDVSTRCHGLARAEAVINAFI